MKKTIIIPGGSGYLGQAIISSYLNEEYKFVILTRSAQKFESTENIRYVQWDGKTLSDWMKELDGAFAIINLSGRSVNCRYTKKNKDAIISSRVNSTTVIGQAIEKAKKTPQVWINSSSATIYRHAEDKLMTETDGELGDDFSPTVCKVWEETANKFDQPNTRKIIARTSMILGRKGGVFPVLKRLANWGLGGKQGSGNQYVSWLHQDDFARIIDYFLNQKVEGIYNVTAPIPETNRLFLKEIQHSLRIKIALPATRIMLKIGAFLIGTESELILKSRNVFPKRLLTEGFVFMYPTAQEAISELLYKSTKSTPYSPEVSANKTCLSKSESVESTL